MDKRKDDIICAKFTRRHVKIQSIYVHDNADMVKYKNIIDIYQR